MAITLPPDASADGYVTEAEADTYHANRLHNDDWTSANSATKEAAIKWATRLLDQEDWLGEKTHANSANSLRWPRTSVYDRDDLLLDGSTLPQFLKDACAEQALLLITGDSTTDDAQKEISKVKIDTVEVEYTGFNKTTQLNSSVKNMIRFYTEAGEGMPFLERA